MTGEPGELYELHLERAEIELLAEPVLIIALDGYIDAGSGVRLAVEHLLSSLEHTVVGTFDVDQLIDYRARRPTLTYQSNAFTDYQAPELLVHQLTDTDGTAFLLLLRAGAGQPVGAVRRRGRAGRRPVRGPADRRVDGDSDGGPAHPADRDVLARHPQPGCCPSRRTGWAPSRFPGTPSGCWSTGSARPGGTPSVSPRTSRTTSPARTTRRPPAR